MPKRPVVHAMWDTAAKVWVATSEDVPGLATEESDLDSLLRKLQAMVPELLELNAIGQFEEAEASFELVATPPLQHVN